MDNTGRRRHLPNFLKGLLVAGGIGGGLLAAFYFFSNSSADPEKLLLAGQYEKACRAMESRMESAYEEMIAGRGVEAAKNFEKMKLLASAVREGKGGGEPKARTAGFAAVEADACYFLAAMGMERLQEKYGEALASAKERPEIPQEELAPVEDNLRQGLALFPDDKRLLRLQGVYCRLTGRFATAEKCLKRAVELDEKFAEAYNDLGLVCVALGRLDEAKSNFEKAILVAGDNGATVRAARYNLGRYYEGLYNFYMKESKGDAKSPDWQNATANKALAISQLEKSLEGDGSPADRAAEAVLARLKNGN